VQAEVEMNTGKDTNATAETEAPRFSTKAAVHAQKELKRTPQRIHLSRLGVITLSAVACSSRAPIRSRSADRAAWCFSKANIRVKIAPTITPASAYTTFEFLSRGPWKITGHSIPKLYD
jgi:hypothetical protein